MDRTDSKNSTPMTRGDSRPVHYELVSREGYVLAVKFSSAYAAALHAKAAWPDQKQDPDRTGKGWDVQVVGADDRPL